MTKGEESSQSSQPKQRSQSCLAKAVSQRSLVKAVQPKQSSQTQPATWLSVLKVSIGCMTRVLPLTLTLTLTILTLTLALAPTQP